MRSILLDFIVSIHYKFRFLTETLHISVYIIDKYLTIKQISSEKFILLGLTALYISCKYEEIYPPSLSEILQQFD